MLSTLIFIATIVGISLALSPLITSTSVVSASHPPAITPFTAEPGYLNADPCVQSCALRYSIEYSSRLSCSGDYPAICVCQSIDSVIADARVCAASACPTIKTNTGYRPVVTAKVLIQSHCASQGMVFNTQTTYWTTPTPIATNVKTPSIDDANGTGPPSPTNAAPMSSFSGAVVSSASIILSSMDKDKTLASPMPVTTSSPASSSSSTPDLPGRSNRTALNPGIIAGTILGGVFFTIAISLFYIWNKRRLLKTNNNFVKLDDLDPERDGEKEVSVSPAKTRDHRISKPFDKEVEVCAFHPGQNPDWTRARKTTMAIDTQCEDFNYISPDLLEALKLTPVPVDRRIEITGVGEETTLIDTKVHLYFRKVGTAEGVERRYPPTTFYVLKKNQDGFGLLLGTADCLKFEVIRSAVLVLKTKKKEQKLDDLTRDREINDHRQQTEEKKKYKKERDKKKERGKETHQDRDGPDRNHMGKSGSNNGRREHGGRA